MTAPAEKHPNADVRMRGFVNRVTVEAALAWLDSYLKTTSSKTELVPLGKAAGRVLAQDIRSRVNVPDFQRAMMDGFAVQAADLCGASAQNPITLKLIGDCFPGQAFAGKLTAGCAVRIMTGAPLPSGVDAVLPAEKTKFSGTIPG